MSENKTYYWLKMNEDFFEEDTIKYIREQQNGDKYLIIYLILCLKSLRTEGIVIRIVGNTLLPYDAKSLASMTGSDIDTVRSAIELFRSIGLIEILDSGAIHMAQIKELVGKETEAARRMRKTRALKKANENSEKPALPEAGSQCDNNVEQCSNNVQECHTDVTQSKESRGKSSDNRDRDKRRESKDTPKVPVKIGTYKNVSLSPDEFDELKNEFPFTYLEQIDRLSEQKKIYGYKYASDYAVLKKWQKEDDWEFREQDAELRQWSADTAV